MNRDKRNTLRAASAALAGFAALGWSGAARVGAFIDELADDLVQARRHLVGIHTRLQQHVDLPHLPLSLRQNLHLRAALPLLAVDQLAAVIGQDVFGLFH